MRAERLKGSSRIKHIDVDEDVIEAIVGHLSDEGAQDFLGQLLNAMKEAKATDDVTPINEVVESWYRTMLFVDKEGFDKAHARARSTRRKRNPRDLKDLLKREGDC